MKLLLPLAIATLIPTLSQAAPLVCSAGELGDDNRIEVKFDPKSAYSLVISQHELFLRADKADLTVRGNSIAIVDRRVEAAAEGEEWAGTVNALLVHNPNKRTLNFTMMLDGFMHAANVELICR